MRTPLVFSPEERGFERVTDDSREALYATDTSRDATGEVDREEFRVRESRGDFIAQKVQLNESGQIVGKQTLGSNIDDREEAAEKVERRVRNTTAAGTSRANVGEFRVKIGSAGGVGLAQRAHLSRSEEARAADRGKRAPVTTDASRYAGNEGELDYPGVDTPKRAPNVLPKDLAQQQQPKTTEPGQTGGQKERESVNVMSGTDRFVLEDEVEAGFGDGEVADEFRRTMASGASAPVNVGEERRNSMVADGMGGPQFNANIGGYVETDAADEEMRPPERALEEQDNFLSIESNEQQAADAGVLDPEPSDPFQIPDGGGLLTDGGGGR